MASKWIFKESKNMERDPPQNCTAGPIDNDMFNW